jgi:protein gp37
MADLFGDWVPQDWIDQVLVKVREHPEWTFIFLTKNPKRLIDIEWPDNAWVGTTVDVQERVKPAEDAFRQIKAKVNFLSCEPMQEQLTFSDLSMFNWMIIGGRSVNSKLPEFKPPKEWIDDLVQAARAAGLKVYQKPNLDVPESTRSREYPSDLLTVRLKIDYTSDWHGSMRLFKEGEIVEISAERAAPWIKRGIVEAVTA